MWFEPMEIPTGSMRPTLRELDHLIISKTDFGLNLPLTPHHLYFDEALVKRGDIIVFTAENMEVFDPKTTYFYLFPGYKRLVKRCMGKPGDFLYFYGGHIYGIDRDGNDLIELREEPSIAAHNHVPFISFEGREKRGARPRETQLFQSGQAIARFLDKPQVGGRPQLKGEIFVDGNWVADAPQAARQPHDAIATYSDFWGFGNYAMTRLLAKSELPPGANAPDDGEAALFLELSHHANLTYPRPRLLEGAQSSRYLLTPEVSYLPLQHQHVKALWDHLYTSRFIVQKGKGYFYNQGQIRPSPYAPALPGVPDGTYEFYDGTGYKVGIGGILSPLPYDHPLCEQTLENLTTLFNFGIEWNTLFAPAKGDRLPSRFAFFRDGDLYVMDGKVVAADDPVLEAFSEAERQTEAASTAARPYLPFIDYGAPLKDGKIDAAFIRRFGLHVPEGHYLALGDNYAISADSRDFGFVPQGNLEGSPWLLLWPPGPRWGFLPQPESPWLKVSNVAVAIAILLASGGYLAYKRLSRKPLPDIP